MSGTGATAVVVAAASVATTGSVPAITVVPAPVDSAGVAAGIETVAITGAEADSTMVRTVLEGGVSLVEGAGCATATAGATTALSESGRSSSFSCCFSLASASSSLIAAGMTI